MSKWKEGDKLERAECDNCGKFTPVTFKYRDVPFEGNIGVVEDILVGVCDECDQVIVVPSQSSPKIKETLAKIKEERNEQL